jgi:hypothetical protein
MCRAFNINKILTIIFTAFELINMRIENGNNLFLITIWGRKKYKLEKIPERIRVVCGLGNIGMRV